MTTPAPASVNATLASYLPGLQLRLLEDASWGEDEPQVRSFAGAVLVVDISGFTELTAQFEARGKVGGEQLSAILRNYFRRLTDLIVQHGGDVISFAGDAALAVWPALQSTETGPLTSRCVTAALAIQAENDAGLSHDGIVLKQRSAIASGQLYAVVLGGSGDKRLFLLTGDPLREAGAALHEVAAGKVALAQSAMSAVAKTVTANVLPSGIFVVSAAAAVESPHQAVPTVTVDPKLPLADYVPAFVADRVVAGLGEWLAEFRNVTVLFVGFPDFDASQGEILLKLQPTAHHIQHVLRRYEGAIYQFLMDDKGLALIAAFGLPPRAHEDDALRGVYAAVEIETGLKPLGIRTSIGVATGSSFCGIYGSPVRRQYTALGRPMNIAARLMQAADGGVLCDLSTTSRAGRHHKFTFQQLDPLQVKGSSAPLTVYRPTASYTEALWTAASVRTRQPLQSGIVGRSREREALANALEHLQAEKTSSLILLEGEAGIGKSRLTEELLRAARSRQLTCLIGTGQAIEKSIAYHAWRPILAAVFGLTNESESAERRRQRVLNQLKPDWQPLGPLLNAALPFEFPETPESRELQGEARADATRHLLLDVIKEYLASEPAVLVLDDAHWFDSASWGLARLAAEQLHPALIVIAMRPEHDTQVEGDLLKMPDVRHLALEPLPSEDVLHLVCQRLGVKTMLQPIAQYVLQLTQGNPLFIEELVYALRDSGAIEIRDAECRLGPKLADSSRSIEELFRQLHMPETVPGIITSRIDRLSPSQQMLVKVASVIGRSFSLATLREVHPAEGERARVPQLLAELENYQILLPIASEEYEFRHPLIQEVVYESIPVAMRRQLHQATAECYERAHKGSVESYAPLLAQHWTAAAVAPKAIHYSALAGEQALQGFAILEAVRFLTTAITLEGELRNSTAASAADDARKRAHWELLLGSAYVSWSKYDEAREHLEHGLALAGHPMPRSTVRGVVALLAEAARQVRIRMSKPRRALNDAERRKQLELTRAYEGLMEIYYLTDKPVPCLYSVFRGLNLAEPAGASPELARCYSSTAALLGFMSFAKWADAYFARALSTGEQAADSSAQAWVFMAKGVYLAGLGQRATAGENLQRSIEIYDRLGDARHGDDARANLAATCYLHGDFRQSLELANRIYRSALVRRDTRVQAECVRWRAYNLLALGRFSEVQSAIDELDSLRSSTVKLGGYHRKQDVATLTALLLLNAGDPKQALEKAKLALELMRSVSDAFEFLLEHAALAEVSMTVYESTPGEKEPADAAGNAVKALTKYARMFPVGRPAQLLYSGRLMSLRGKNDKAQAGWQKCLQTAESLSMPLYQALAHYEIARQLPASDAARREHLSTAQQLFERLGVPHRADVVRTSMASAAADH